MLHPEIPLARISIPKVAESFSLLVIRMRRFLLSMFPTPKFMPSTQMQQLSRFFASARACAAASAASGSAHPRVTCSTCANQFISSSQVEIRYFRGDLSAFKEAEEAYLRALAILEHASTIPEMPFGATSRSYVDPRFPHHQRQPTLKGIMEELAGDP